MVHRKNGVGRSTKRIWRITSNAPHGEYVDPAQLSAELTHPPDKPEPGWLVSSFELNHGLDVSDETQTIPGALLDELFKDK